MQTEAIAGGRETPKVMGGHSKSRRRLSVGSREQVDVGIAVNRDRGGLPHHDLDVAHEREPCGRFPVHEVAPESVARGAVALITRTCANWR